MKYSNLQKKTSSKEKPSSFASVQAYEDRDAVILALIKGINMLIMQANASEMSTASRILCNAREELVHWAVDMNFHETVAEQFINEQLYGGHVVHATLVENVASLLDRAVKVLEERRRESRVSDEVKE